MPGHRTHPTLALRDPLTEIQQEARALHTAMRRLGEDTCIVSVGRRFSGGWELDLVPTIQGALAAGAREFVLDLTGAPSVPGKAVQVLRDVDDILTLSATSVVVATTDPPLLRTARWAGLFARWQVAPSLTEALTLLLRQPIAPPATTD
jgi:hypothetical protein